MSKYVTLTGYCSTTKKPFGIQCEVRDGDYVAVGSFATSAAGGAAKDEELNGKLYAGGNFKCKHCGNDCIIKCSCGAVICLSNYAPNVVCPKCGTDFKVNWVDIDQLPKTTIKGDKQ